MAGLHSYSADGNGADNFPSGFFVGPEGPLLYMGAVIGSGVSQVR